MRVSHLGGPNLLASRLCRGQLNTRAQTGEPAADGIVDPASVGRTAFFVATANMCGGTGDRGWPEEFIGRSVDGICPGGRSASEASAW